MPRPEIKLLLRILDEAYSKKAWHGPNLRGSIRGVTANEAAWRPAPGRHNIWEIMVHAAYWKYAVRRRVRGDKRGSFVRKGSNWFACRISRTVKAWRADVALLEQEHQRLRQVIATLPRQMLHKRPSGTGASLLDNIVGIALHDVYHAGQIQLLKRLWKAGKRG